jgi:hypothetical protein
VRVSPRGFLALRAAFIVGFVLVWNGVMLLAIRSNGGTGRIDDPAARWVTCGLMAVTSVLAGSILASARFRALVTAPSRRDRYDPSPYWLVCVVCGVLAILIALERG